MQARTKIVKRKNKEIKISKLLIFCIITTIIVIDISIAKYQNNAKLSGTAKVALMANDVYADFGEEIKGYPGCEPQIYEIEITNKEEEKICEVSQKYLIKIERDESINIPLEISLYKDANCNEILAPNVNNIYDETDFRFEAGEEGNKKLYIKFNWPKAYKNSSYAFEIDYIRVHIIAEQID